LKIATLNVFKIFVICVLLLIPRGSNNELHNDDQNLIKVGQVTNEIRMGKFAGNRNLTIGVRNILEELLLDLDYDLSDQASTQINVRLVFFDIKDIGTNIGILHKDVALTQIIAIGELEKNGKVEGEDFWWMVKTDEGHGFFKEANKIELYSELEEFFGRYLKDS